ncbi:hypothetical protein KCP69_13090 [Salmonella enterica subsp. enterica]|nr:hypothetical protein KCP69_13090 [Salmonella enterica subsp. enterica]
MPPLPLGAAWVLPSGFKGARAMCDLATHDGDVGLSRCGRVRLGIVLRGAFAVIGMFRPARGVPLLRFEVLRCKRWPAYPRVRGRRCCEIIR